MIEKNTIIKEIGDLVDGVREERDRNKLVKVLISKLYNEGLIEEANYFVNLLSDEEKNDKPFPRGMILDYIYGLANRGDYDKIFELETPVYSTPSFKPRAYNIVNKLLIPRGDCEVILKFKNLIDAIEDPFYVYTMEIKYALCNIKKGEIEKAISHLDKVKEEITKIQEPLRVYFRKYYIPKCGECDPILKVFSMLTEAYNKLGAENKVRDVAIKAIEFIDEVISFLNNVYSLDGLNRYNNVRLEGYICHKAEMLYYLGDINKFVDLYMECDIAIDDITEQTLNIPTKRISKIEEMLTKNDTAISDGYYIRYLFAIIRNRYLNNLEKDCSVANDLVKIYINSKYLKKNMDIENIVYNKDSWKKVLTTLKKAGYSEQVTHISDAIYDRIDLSKPHYIQDILDLYVELSDVEKVKDLTKIMENELMREDLDWFNVKIWIYLASVYIAIGEKEKAVNIIEKIAEEIMKASKCESRFINRERINSIIRDLSNVLLMLFIIEKK